MSEKPIPFEKIDNDILALSGWKAGDGPVPGVFDGKPAGSRCLWGCAWATKKGVIRPGENGWMITDFMSAPELYFEARDVLARGERGANPHAFDGLQAEYYDCKGNPEEGGGLFCWLKDLRPRYPEYCAPFSLPPLDGWGRVVWVRERPGWKLPEPYHGRAR